MSPELASKAPPAAGHSFWSSAPNLLKALAGLLTAVAALTAPLYQFGTFGSKERHVQTTVTQTAAPQPSPPATTPAQPAGPDLASLRRFVDGLDVLLVDAIDLSIRVDRAALAFVEAWFGENDAARNVAWKELLSGSTQATAKKAEFAREYNAVRTDHGLGTFRGEV